MRAQAERLVNDPSIRRQAADFARENPDVARKAMDFLRGRKW
jgi:hypothetical protein